MNVKSIVVGGGFGNLWVALNSYTEFVLTLKKSVTVQYSNENSI